MSAKRPKSALDRACPHPGCEFVGSSYSITHHYNDAHLGRWVGSDADMKEKGFAGCSLCRKLFILNGNKNHRPFRHSPCKEVSSDPATPRSSDPSPSPGRKRSRVTSPPAPRLRARRRSPAPSPSPPPPDGPGDGPGGPQPPDPGGLGPIPRKLSKAAWERESNVALGLLIEHLGPIRSTRDLLERAALGELAKPFATRFFELGGFQKQHGYYVHPAELQRRAAGPFVSNFDAFRVIWLASIQGEPGKAVRQLTDDSRVLSPSDPLVWAQLPSLYPKARRAVEQEPPPPSRDWIPPPANGAERPCPPASDKDFRRALWVLCRDRKTKGAGLHGWSFRKLMQVWGCEGDLACINFLRPAQLVEFILDGTVNVPALRPFFVDQRGVALSKPPKAGSAVPGVRPIGIMVVFTRLAGSYLVQANPDSLKALMHDDCYGFQVRGGPEKLFLNVRTTLRANPTFAWLHCDFGNAFNVINREKILDLADRFPKLRAYLYLVYGAPSSVFYGDQPPILNESGVVQGEPAAGAVFEAAIQPGVTAVRDRHPDIRILGEFDDHHLLGLLPGLVDAFFDLGEVMATEYGLHMQWPKCFLYVQRPEDLDDPAIQRLVDKGVQVVNFAADPAERGMCAAGIPFGSPEFVEAKVAKQQRAALQLLAALDEVLDLQLPAGIPSLHGIYYATRVVVLSLMTYLYRTLSIRITRPFARQLTDAINNQFLCWIGRVDLAGMENAPLDPDRLLLSISLSLPTRLGGMGLVDGWRTAPAAVIGSLRLCGEALQKRTGVFTSSDAVTSLCPELGEALEALEAMGCPPKDDLVAAPSFFALPARGHGQAELTSLLDERQYDHALALLPPGNSPERRRFRSASGAHAGAAFDANPGFCGARMDNVTFAHQACLKLGLRPAQLLGLPALYKCPMPLCHHVGIPGDNHYLLCSIVGFTVRHEYLEEAVKDSAHSLRSRTAIAVVRQPVVAAYLPRRDDQPWPRGKPPAEFKADLLVSALNHHRKLVDHSVVYPTAQYAASSVTNGAAARERELEKIKKYTDRFFFPHAAQIDLVPIGIETFGSIGKSGIEFVGWLAGLGDYLHLNGAGTGDCDGLYSRFVSQTFARLNAALALGNAHMLERWLSKGFPAPATAGIAMEVAHGPDDDDPDFHDPEAAAHAVA